VNLRHLTVSCLSIGLLITVVGPSGLPSAEAYGQDQVCADKCRGGMEYCVKECLKPIKECAAKCEVDTKKQFEQMTKKDRDCLLACNTKTAPCRKGCDRQQHTCYGKCQQ
jgi:hypothetical protein